ncbi:hypothetical protein KC19_N010300 [Ceratodon purpureus]|nr:hypothetical protein KC19_N010300 [Ceratodon purpureus]
MGSNNHSLMDCRPIDSGLEPLQNYRNLTMVASEINDEGNLVTMTYKRLHLTWQSNMHRPTKIFPKKKENGNYVCFGNKPSFESPRELPFLDVVCSRVFVAEEAEDPGNGPRPLLESQIYSIAGHKGLLCIEFPLCKNLIVCKVCNPFLEPESKLVRVLPETFKDSRQFNGTGLIHIRVDDNGKDYKILVAGNDIVKSTLERTSRYTEEYDSKTDEWESAKNPNFGGFLHYDSQTGAYDTKSEFLFCISILDDLGNRGVQKYDFKTKGWRTCSIPSELAASVWQPLGIEECGGMIFLFSLEECSTNEELSHVNFLIHQLKIDDSRNVSFEEITRKKRIRSTRKEFFVYPNTTCIPSKDAIQISDGCVYVFNLTFSVSGNFVSIHELNPDGSGLWGNEIKRLPTQEGRTRVPNWLLVEGLDKAFQEFKNEAHLKKLKGADVWVYISKSLWEFAAFIRSPKQCQQKEDTCKRPVRPIAGMKPTPSPPTHRKKRRGLLTDSEPSSSALLEDSATRDVEPPALNHVHIEPASNISSRRPLDANTGFSLLPEHETNPSFASPNRNNQTDEDMSIFQHRDELTQITANFRSHNSSLLTVESRGLPQYSLRHDGIGSTSCNNSKIELIMDALRVFQPGIEEVVNNIIMNNKARGLELVTACNSSRSLVDIAKSTVDKMREDLKTAQSTATETDNDDTRGEVRCCAAGVKAAETKLMENQKELVKALRDYDEHVKIKEKQIDAQRVLEEHFRLWNDRDGELRP